MSSYELLPMLLLGLVFAGMAVMLLSWAVVLLLRRL